MKQQFLKRLAKVDRKGMTELLDHIENNTDFFTAPASSKYHGAKAGGLVEHSLVVYYRLQEIVDRDREANGSVFDDTPADSVAIAALLHDYCKANFYKVDYRNAKNEKSVWEKVPYYVIEDKDPLGHGEKSVILLQNFIKLTDEEMYAIRWHMGGFDDSAKGGFCPALSAAMNKYPLVTALHMADLAASYFDHK